MKNKKLNIIDCTLRDGGYYNNWNFSVELINEYLKVMSAIRIDYVEIGFRFIDKVKTKGPTAYSDEKFLRKLKIPKNLMIGVMINASDFASSNDILNLAKQTFKKKKNSLVSLVRIACHYYEIKNIFPLVNWLKKSGYKVGINIMQIPELSKKQIKSSILEIKKSQPDILYFADSLGSLNPKSTIKIINQIRLSWKKDIGIHAHDNMGKALNNTIASIKSNQVNWIDCTVTGMGRGPGNTQTEYLLFELGDNQFRKNNYVDLLNLIKEYFEPLKQKYKWGTNPFYYFAGLNSIHPSFVQEMISEGSFNQEDIFKNLKYLSSIGGKKFSKDLISLNDRYYKKPLPGNWKPKNLLKNKNVLIIGPGNTVKSYKKRIINFIKKKSPLVFVLNAHKSLPSRYTDAHIVCNKLRLLSDLGKYKKLDKQIITPYSSFSDNIKSKISFKKILNFGLGIKNKKFIFKDNYALLPNSLAITYALGICTSGEAKRIYLAGMDGYSKDHPKKFEMDYLFEMYKRDKQFIKLASLTPTNYNL